MCSALKYDNKEHYILVSEPQSVNKKALGSTHMNNEQEMQKTAIASRISNKKCSKPLQHALYQCNNKPKYSPTLYQPIFRSQAFLILNQLISVVFTTS